MILEAKLPYTSYTFWFSDSDEDRSLPGGISLLTNPKSNIATRGHDCIHVKVRASGQYLDFPWQVQATSKCKKYDNLYEKSFRLKLDGSWWGLNTLGFLSGKFYWTETLSSAFPAYAEIGPSTIKWVQVAKGQFGWKSYSWTTRYTIDWPKRRYRTVTDWFTCDPQPTAEAALASQHVYQTIRTDWQSTGFRNIDVTPKLGALDEVAWRYAIAYHDEIENNSISLTSQIRWDTIASAIAENTDVNRTNALALLHDILSLPTEITNYPKLFDTLCKSFVDKRPKEILRNLSNIFLSGKYGIRLTIPDLKLISNNLLGKRPPKTKTSASQSGDFVLLGRVFQGYARTSLQYEFEQCYRLYSLLESMNLTVRLTDLWDLVPYSFVVDWFVGVGDYLDYLDQKSRISKLHCSDIWNTIKGSTRASLLHVNGLEAVTLEIDIYYRYASEYLTPLSPGSYEPVAHQHVAEGTALILQRL